MKPTRDSFLAASNDKREHHWDNSRYGLGFNYANGPLNIDLVYQVRQDVTGFRHGFAW